MQCKLRSMLGKLRGERRDLALKLAVVATLLLVAASVAPVPEAAQGLEEQFEISYVLHVLAYMFTGFLWIAGLSAEERILNVKVITALVLLAPLTELLQLLLPYRCACLEDLVANVVGEALALIAWLAL